MLQQLFVVRRWLTVLIERCASLPGFFKSNKSLSDSYTAYVVCEECVCVWVVIKRLGVILCPFLIKRTVTYQWQRTSSRPSDRNRRSLPRYLPPSPAYSDSSPPYLTPHRDCGRKYNRLPHHSYHSLSCPSHRWDRIKTEDRICFMAESCKLCLLTFRREVQTDVQEQVLPEMQNSVIAASDACRWKVGWSFVANKLFLGLHGKTMFTAFA